MSNSIGVAVNFYREPNTLPGFIESAARFFDDMLFVSAPPPGAPPDDESIAIIERWGGRIIHSTIAEGFGVVRTKCLHESSTEWVAIMDCDERILPVLPIYVCKGTGRYPKDQVPNLSVGIAAACFNQGDRIRHMVDHEATQADSIRFMRRHWMDWAMKLPCQNWSEHPDWQLRFLRNRDYIGYETTVRMHERCIDFRTGKDPIYATSDDTHGPFFDHFHVPAKLMEPEQRTEDIAIYDALHFGNADWSKLYPK